MSPAPDGATGADVVRWRLTVAYDGSGFRGFAEQSGLPTVSASLADAIGRVARAPVTLTCAGRTDAGVHALGQVVHFDLPDRLSGDLEPDRLVKACNRQLEPAIVVREAGPAPAGFDARRSARWRRYRYLVVNAAVADPLLSGLAWHVADPLELRSMAAASDALLGEHDFRSFCRRAPGTAASDPIPRRVLRAGWRLLADADRVGDGSAPLLVRGPVLAPPGSLAPPVGRLLAFEIEATSFCHQMVRSVTGTLVDVGRGKKRPADVPFLLASSDRGVASQPAPAHGLTLMAVGYDTPVA